MYQWVPFINGRYFTYNEYFSAVVFAVFLAVGGLFLLFSRLVKRFTQASTKIQDNKHKKDEDLYSQPSFLPINDSFSHEELPLEPKKRFSFSDFAVIYLNWTGWGFIALSPTTLSLFDILFSPSVAAVVMFIILFLRLTHAHFAEMRDLNKRLRQRKDHLYHKKKAASLTLSYRRTLAILFVASLISSYSLTGGCISFYEEFVGITIYNFKFSTTLMRYFELNDICPPGPPCHIYATLPEAAQSGVFINIHTADIYEGVKILFEEKTAYQVSKKFGHSQVMTSFKLSHLERRGRRTVHSALLKDLTPDTTYTVAIYYDNSIQAMTEYQTLPDETSTRDVVIVTGGDMGDRLLARNITKHASAVNPDVIVIGGDLSYDDGEQTCYFTWDNMLRSFAQSTIAAGRLIPFLFSVGNHDVGLNTLSNRNLTIDLEGPLYMILFPQNTVSEYNALSKRKETKVPALHERKSYHYHTFGNILFFNLDSGYLSYFTEQAKFIENYSKRYPSHVKLAALHSPTYWACKNIVSTTVLEAQTKWVPLFDKYRFMTIFENHEHNFKKTFPLKANKPAKDGTYYVGNGKWGVTESDKCVPANKTGVLEVAKDVNHFWVANVSIAEDIVRYSAFDQEGRAVIPSFSQEIHKYVN